MNVGHYMNITSVFYTLVFWAYHLKVKSNFDDLGVYGLLVIRATTFILGVGGHVVEKVVENLGFTMEKHKNPVPWGVKNSKKCL